MTRTYTIDDIRRRQDELQAAIGSQEKVLRKDFDALIGGNKAVPDTSIGRWVSRAEKAYYLADAVIWGYKMLNILRRKSPKKKR